MVDISFKHRPFNYTKRITWQPQVNPKPEMPTRTTAKAAARLQDKRRKTKNAAMEPKCENGKSVGRDRKESQDGVESTVE